MKQFSNIYRGRRVLVTGHTGFKGSWLALWLHELGAVVSGVALAPPTTPNHWDLLAVDCDDHRLDIRDAAALTDLFSATQPEIVFHLAAQSLVRRSFGEPAATWDSNVMGTVNVLEACRLTPQVRAVVVVTSDKCYQNREWSWGYRENDRLGGHDPYSASKAAAELATASYRNAFFAAGGPLAATARAGNVIGGGDWAQDRLIPDLVRALANKQALEIRSPAAIRPWQHVLDPLGGYLLLGQKLLAGDNSCAAAWNFGPDPQGERTVSGVLDALKREWPDLAWRVSTEPQLHETTVLRLDSAKARNQLHWRPVWRIDKALAATAAWSRSWAEQGEIISRSQLRDYSADAASAGAVWIEP